MVTIILLYTILAPWEFNNNRPPILIDNLLGRITFLEILRAPLFCKNFEKRYKIHRVSLLPFFQKLYYEKIFVLKFKKKIFLIYSSFEFCYS